MLRLRLRLDGCEQVSQMAAKTIMTSEKLENFNVSDRYKNLKLLGEGSYGTVCSAIDLKSIQIDAYHTDVQLQSTTPHIAIKKVHNIFHKKVLLKRAIRELCLMKHFNGHKNIISLVKVKLDDGTSNGGLYCYQELCDFDLAGVIYSPNQFSEFHIQSFTYQILCGLKYIHSADVIHRDLKPGNILVTMQGTLKICDFGLARGINHKFQRGDIGETPITNYVATRWYRAPELMLSNNSYNKSIDMWAVGCILAELYGRRPLFLGKDQVMQVSEILKVLGTPPESLIRLKNWQFTPFNFKYLPISFSSVYPNASNLAISLLENLLLWDCDQRLRVEESLNHPFFEGIRSAGAEIKCSKIFDFSFEHQCRDLHSLNLKLRQEVEEFNKIIEGSTRK